MRSHAERTEQQLSSLIETVSKLVCQLSVISGSGYTPTDERVASQSGLTSPLNASSCSHSHRPSVSARPPLHSPVLDQPLFQLTQSNEPEFPKTDSSLDEPLRDSLLRAVGTSASLIEITDLIAAGAAVNGKDAVSGSKSLFMSIQPTLPPSFP